MSILSNYVIGFGALYESETKCRRGVLWKGSVMSYNLHCLERTLKMSDNLKDSTYKQSEPKIFTITSPKERQILSISFKDRIYQRSLNDNAIYPTLTNRFIYDNMACQKGKGTDAARNRLKELIWREYRRSNSKTIYVLKCDIKKYYDNIQHENTARLFNKYLDPDVSKMALDILEYQYKGEKGYCPGSQMVQLVGLVTLDELDHFIKEKLKCKSYIRYMDDFLLISSDKEYLQKCKDEIQNELKKIGLELHSKKTRISKVEDGVMFLGFKFKLTKTGKVIMTLDKDNVKREKRKLKRLVDKCKRGEITKDKVDESYRSWRNHAAKGNSHHLLRFMDDYYKNLWR